MNIKLANISEGYADVLLDGENIGTVESYTQHFNLTPEGKAEHERAEPWTP